MLLFYFGGLCRYVKKCIHEGETISLVLVFYIYQQIFRFFFYVLTSLSFDFAIFDLIRQALKSLNLLIDHGQVCQTCIETAVEPYFLTTSRGVIFGL